MEMYKNFFYTASHLSSAQNWFPHVWSLPCLRAIGHHRYMIRYLHSSLIGSLGCYMSLTPTAVKSIKAVTWNLTPSAVKSTRASAQRVTNTPGQRHFFIIEYFKVNDNDIRQDIVHNVSFWVTLIYHPKYNFPGVNSLQDMKQIWWALKYRSLTYIYLRN